MSLATDLNIVNKGLNDLFTSKGSDAHIGLGDLLIEIANSGGGGGGTWGSITGDIADQADLEAALNWNHVSFTIGATPTMVQGGTILQVTGGDTAAPTRIALVNTNSGKQWYFTAYDSANGWNGALGGFALEQSGTPYFAINADTGNTMFFQNLQIAGTGGLLWEGDGQGNIGGSPAGDGSSLRPSFVAIRDYLGIGNDDGSSNIVYIDNNDGPRILMKNAGNEGSITFSGDENRFHVKKPIYMEQLTYMAEFQLPTGINNKMGSGTLVGGTVVVNNNTVSATSRIYLTTQTPGGTPGALYVSARNPGSSFTVTSTSGTDTSTFAYLIIEFFTP